MTATVVTFGELMLRLAAPGFERLLQTPALAATFGGAEANVAVALAAFGVAARYVTVLPAGNPIADAAVADLRRHGVDTSAIVRGRGRVGIYYLETGAGQRPSRVVYDRDHSGIALAKPGDIDWRRAFEGARWFHISGITPAISASAADLAFESMRAARETKLTVSCDLNYRRNLWKWGKSAVEIMTELAANADVLVGNEEDIQRSLGFEPRVSVGAGALDPSQYERLTATVLEAYPNLRAIAITLRESPSASANVWSGCLRDRATFITGRRYDIAHIVDRIGTGDAFAAGLIYGLTEDWPSADALDFAIASGCLKHSIPGDFSRCTVGEVDALRRGGSTRIER